MLILWCAPRVSVRYADIDSCCTLDRPGPAADIKGAHPATRTSRKTHPAPVASNATPRVHKGLRMEKERALSSHLITLTEMLRTSATSN